LAKECAKLLAKSYGYGGPSLGINPNAVSYVQPVQLVASGAPIAAIPLGPGIGGIGGIGGVGGYGGFKDFKDVKGHHKGSFKSSYGVPNLGGLGVPPLNTYGAPSLPLPSSYGTPPLSLGGGFNPGLGAFNSFGSQPPIVAPAPILPQVAVPPPVQNIKHVHHHLYDNKKVLPYAPTAPVYTQPPVYNRPAPPAPVYNRPAPAAPVYNRPPPPAYNPAPPAYNPAPPAYNPVPNYSNPPAQYSGISGKESCVCVPTQQCPAYDVIGRVSDYQLDPRKVKSNITAEAEEEPEVTRRRRQINRRRRGDAPLPVDGQDAVTVVSSEPAAGRSLESSASSDSTDTVPAAEGAQGSTATGVQAREGRQFGGGFPTCSYQEVCCRSQPRPNQYSGASSSAGTCGRRNPSGITGRIKTLSHVDGESEFGEYPWQVAILKKDQYDNVYVCGGALVGPNHVLTAAHCIKGHPASELRVRLGEWDVNRETEFYPHVEKDVTSILIHPEFYQGNLYNDIALVKFEGFVDLARYPHVSPACLPPKYQDFTGSRCWVTGWGKDSFGTVGKYQNILKEVDVPVINNVDCENKLRRTRLGYDFKLDSGFICAGGEEGKDACKGDGGGPLVCEKQGIWYLSGIVSWGVGCGQHDVPGVYTKVSEYTDWVQKNIYN